MRRIARFKVGSARISVVFVAGRYLVNYSKSVYSAPLLSWRFNSSAKALEFAHFLMKNKKVLK